MQTHYALPGRLMDDNFRVFRHAAFMGLILFFWFLFSFERLDSAADVGRLVLYASTYIAVAYLNMYYLFPRFLLRGKAGAYVGLSFASFLTSYLLQNLVYFKGCEALVNDLTPSLPLLADIGINSITYCMFIGIGLSAKYIGKWIRSELRVSALEKENLRAELNSLRSQVSPHFLFNTFNNLYVLTKTDPGLAGEMLLGFADLMRYQLNESQNDKVALESEIRYIANLLQLEKLRKNHLDLRIRYEAKLFGGIEIEPLLFVSLVENAVKHGSQQMERPFIHVELARRNGSLVFEVVNSRPAVSQLGKEQSLGRGLDNLRKRLLLSYPGRHELELREDAERFTARLEIHLS